MKYTSAEANKLLKKIEEEKNILLKDEDAKSVFNCAVGENVSDVKPLYDFAETQKKIDELDMKIRNIKHEINIFNAEVIVPEFNMTIDQVLILIPQLSAQKTRLMRMQTRQPKARDKSLGNMHSNIIDYVYANYNIEEAAEAYNKVADELRQAQLALDKINNSVLIEIDI